MKSFFSRHGKEILLAILVLLLSGVAAGVLWAFRREAPTQALQSAALPVETLLVQPATYEAWITSHGTVEPQMEIRLIAEVDGKVVWVSPEFETGGAFEVGDVLLKLDSRDYEWALKRAQARLRAAEVALQLVQAEADSAKRDWDSFSRPTSPSSLVLKEPQIAEASANRDAAQAEVSKAELDLERTQLKAPFAGRVRQTAVDLGQFVRRGEELARLFGVEQVHIPLPLSVEEFAYLPLHLAVPNEGQATQELPRVELSADFGQSEARWEAQVKRVTGSIDVSTRMVSVIAVLNHPYQISETQEAPLKVGMFVKARIKGKSYPDVYVLPRHVIRNGNQVYVVDSDNKVRFRTIEILRRESKVVVVAQGLKPGERICLSPIDLPVDGMDVKITQETSSGGLSL